MRLLKNLLDKQGKLFAKGTKLERLYPLHEAGDTFFFTPGEVTKSASHVRDALDIKRTMMAVVAALAGCVLMAFYNTGYQANLAIANGAGALDTWRTGLMEAMALPFDPANFLACFVHGGLYYLPVLIVTLAVGGAWEAVFAIVRRHEINEGFLVTWMLFPLILPPTVLLWQVALGITFGVVVGKEVFGGTGYNVLNPALVARAFVLLRLSRAAFGGPGMDCGEDRRRRRGERSHLARDRCARRAGWHRRGPDVVAGLHGAHSRLDGRNLDPGVRRRRGAPRGGRRSGGVRRRGG